MYDLIGKLSEIRSEYNCFDEDEEPYYRALSEAIRILSQRVDGDAIRRQSAIESVPSAQPEQRWIPVSERLPEERDWYLGIFKEPDTGWINPLPFICDYLLSVKTKFTTKEGWILKDCTDREEHIDYYFNLECVAWMPLPKPYKADMRGEEVNGNSNMDHSNMRDSKSGTEHNTVGDAPA